MCEDARALSEIDPGVTHPAGNDELAPVFQQRAMQSRVTLTSTKPVAAGVSQRWPIGRTALGEADTGDQGARAGNRVHDAGTCRVIHMLWNGFLPGAAGRGENPSFPTLVDCASGWAWGCAALTAGSEAFWVHAAGSGNAAAANCGRNDEPATRARKTPIAATIATAGCRRRSLPAPHDITVARLYNAILGPQAELAVKTLKGRCAPAAGGAPASCRAEPGRAGGHPQTISGMAVSAAVAAP